MMKFKFKNLILLIFVLSINKYSLDIFADTPDGTSNDIPTIETSSPNTTNTQDNSTILDGEIGEWDPNLDDNPDFDNEDIDEIDGHKPQDDEYYTISVTVPLDMEFYVLPNSQLALGSFYSPIYTIKNNGSKNISVAINSFVQENDVQNNVDSDAAPLYVEKLNDKDGKTQMELKMCAIDKLDVWSKVSKEIDLTEINELQDTDKELYVLSANETKGIKFSSERWELPQNEAHKDKAISNFRAGFVFSVVRPETENNTSTGTQN